CGGDDGRAVFAGAGVFGGDDSAPTVADALGGCTGTGRSIGRSEDLPLRWRTGPAVAVPEGHKRGAADSAADQLDVVAAGNQRRDLGGDRAPGERQHAGGRNASLAVPGL